MPARATTSSERTHRSVARNLDKRQMRERLLVAAREIAAEQGWQSVTIRRIADRLDYTSPLLYQHFQNKEALLYELLREGFRTLLVRLQDARDTDPGVESLALAYWKFAFTSPELYQVMHGLDGVPFGTANAPIEAQQCFQLARDALSATAAEHGVEVTGLDGVIDSIWALLHGFVSLAMAGRIAGGPTRARTIMLQSVVRLVMGRLGLGAQTEPDERKNRRAHPLI